MDSIFVQQARLEKKLCDLLDEAIERTKQNVEKKRKALTVEVMEEEEAHTESESVAMGWDGKPIPYWLYKLGLGQEYKCEICGNYSYGGKRAFERHFEEWRHGRGLLRLGITGKVNRITLVEEAKDLWNTLPESQKVRLRADGNLRPLPRLKDQEFKESNPSQAPTGVAIPPPDIKTMLERTAFFLAKEGLETERRVTDKYENEAIFSFLNSSDPYHAFYQHKLTEYRAQNQDGAQATHIQPVAPTRAVKWTIWASPSGHSFAWAKVGQSQMDNGPQNVHAH
ncbi:PREDICTED: pre-mRNA-splicing factor sap61-like [Camelina sativa]|uniref:Pre-mRNA-splicing factor sap61-like n=1 Tax=Camelina sativa TaxID=90675 RepID=A0ABM0TCE7_CAMSA|nr:PREDICTED: pre-mRNA-splicing factor sap61-like [Camelina sativa]